MRKKHASECAMLCHKPAFGVFMFERHGAGDAHCPDDVADAVRKTLGIASRSVLNRDDAAVARWIDLRAEYSAWMNGGEYAD
jgi:hypothetical protein